MKLVQSSGCDHIGFTNILIMLWQDNQSLWLLQSLRQLPSFTKCNCKGIKTSQKLEFVLKSMRHNKKRIYWCKYVLDLGSVASDLDVAKVCKAIQIPGMLFSEDEIIMSHGGQWGGLKRWLLWLDNQWEIGKMCWGMAQVMRWKNLAKMSYRLRVVSVVLFAIHLNT